MKKKGAIKTGGRQKDTPNKVTGEMRIWIQQLIDQNREQLEADLKLLEPKDRWQIIERLMSYCIPKMQTVDSLINLSDSTDESLNGFPTLEQFYGISTDELIKRAKALHELNPD